MYMYIEVFLLYFSFFFLSFWNFKILLGTVARGEERLKRDKYYKFSLFKKSFQFLFVLRKKEFIKSGGGGGSLFQNVILIFFFFSRYTFFPL